MKIQGFYATREVFIDGRRLSPISSQKLRNHSPDGFNWGYGGSGPSQLALALLLHFYDPAVANEHYQAFKWDVIAKLPHANFDMDSETITTWMAEQLALKEDADLNRGDI